ncbi:hypothetical protein GE061_003279 [Apolygus lucorum]|uniref:Uncharacterized protein n=1 Tax=Apolygus lucorum TaxID=248454 RepID=A0A8S9X1P3_APOLU|nr:hypothetical protein GE061_003279 [Apolygus lucorum]
MIGTMEIFYDIAFLMVAASVHAYQNYHPNFAPVQAYPNYHPHFAPVIGQNFHPNFAPVIGQNIQQHPPISSQWVKVPNTVCEKIGNPKPSQLGCVCSSLVGTGYMQQAKWNTILAAGAFTILARYRRVSCPSELICTSIESWRFNMNTIKLQFTPIKTIIQTLLQFRPIKTIIHTLLELLVNSFIQTLLQPSVKIFIQILVQLLVNIFNNTRQPLHSGLKFPIQSVRKSETQNQVNWVASARNWWEQVICN